MAKSQLQPGKAPNTFEIKKRLADVVIGDEKQNDFYPRVKTKHWSNEANFSIGVIDDQEGKAHIKNQNGVVEWQKGDLKARFYELQNAPKPAQKTTELPYPISEPEDGAFEFDLEIAAPPKSNYIPFSIETKGLSFEYQPKLTEQEKLENKVTRPINVEQSYAVYHKSKRNNKYKTGKAFHIYRPLIWDADGKWTWGDLDIDKKNKRLYVIIPKKWLAKAVYPIVVDPTLGLTTKGSTGLLLSDDSAGSFGGKFNIESGVDGTLDSVHLYLWEDDGNTIDGYFSVYKEDGSGNADKVFCGTEQYGSEGWYSSTAGSETLAASDTLLVGMPRTNGGGTKNSEVHGWYDTVTGHEGYSVEDSTIYDCTTSQIPSSDLYLEQADRHYSFYITYTASATEEPPTVTTQAVSSIDETTATGNGNVTDDGGATITERGVCWNTTGTPTTADSKATSAGTTGAFTASMTGLTANTLYYVRAYAINSEGTSYGSEVSFTTNAAVSLPTVVTNAVTNIQETP